MQNQNSAPALLRITTLQIDTLFTVVARAKTHSGVASDAGHHRQTRRIMRMNAVTRGVIKRLGRRQGEPVQQDRDIDSEIDPISIPDDYKELITRCFRVMGLPDEQICINVRSVGQRPSGLEVYAAFVKVLRWDASVVTMLSKMPLIEKRIDRVIRHSNMPRYSSFAGLWFRSPPAQDGIAASVH
jgi:hypothetical protein